MELRPASTSSRSRAENLRRVREAARATWTKSFRPVWLQSVSEVHVVHAAHAAHAAHATHAAHAAHAGAGAASLFLGLGFIGDHRAGGEQESRNARGVLERDPH